MIKNLHRASFLIGIFLLLISSLSLVFGHEGFAERIVAYAYGLLIVGVVFYTLELTRK